MGFAIRRNMKTGGQKGVSAIEFAILLPLLVVILFGIIEFSILFYDKAVITNASREGARKGIVHPNKDLTDAQILVVVEDVVDNYLKDSEDKIRLITFGDNNSYQTSVAVDRGASDTYLSVTVAYQFEFLVLSNLIKLLAPGSSFASGITLDGVTQMRME